MSEMMRIPSGEIWRDENNTTFLILKDQGTFLNSMLHVDGQRPENVQVTERYSTNPGMISFVKKAKLTMKVGFVGGGNGTESGMRGICADGAEYAGANTWNGAVGCA